MVRNVSGVSTIGLSLLVGGKTLDTGKSALPLRGHTWQEGTLPREQRVPRVCNVFMLAPAFYNRTICHWLELGLGLGLGGDAADLPVLRVLLVGV